MSLKSTDTHPLTPDQNVPDSTTYMPSSFGSTLNSMYQSPGPSRTNIPMSFKTNYGFADHSPITNMAYQSLTNGGIKPSSFGSSGTQQPNVFNSSRPQSVSTGTSNLNVEGAFEGAETAVDDIESVSSMAMDADPVTAIAQVGRMMGNGLNSIMNASANFNTNSDYVRTMATGHGIGLQQVATNTASLEYSNNSLSSLGGSIGAMFGGSLGALAGRGIASLFGNDVSEGQKILNTPNGMQNPQAGTTPQSQSSRQPGEQPSIDTSNAGMENFNDSTQAMNTDQAQDVQETTL